MSTSTAVLEAPRRPRPSPSRAGWSSRRVLGLALLGLLALHLVVRGAVAVRSYFYWDDFILVGRAGSMPLLSTEFLLYGHDGHFMPAAFLLAGLVNTVAPLQWAGPALVLVILQLAASLAVLRVLVLIVGMRPAVLAPWMLYLFSPLTLPAFSWWAAGLNALPLQFALAWVAGDAILLSRTGRPRYLVSGVGVFVVALLFFEKALLIPVVAFAVVLLACRGEGRPWQGALRTTWRLWLGMLLVVAGWAAVYSAVAADSRAPADTAAVGDLMWATVLKGLVPALFGGPWRWDRWAPAPPWGTPPTVLVVVCAIALVALAAFMLVRKRGAVGILAFAVAGVAVSQLPILLTRSGPNTAPELVQTLRYLADVAVLMALALALLIAAPARARKPSRAAAARARRLEQRPSAARARRVDQRRPVTRSRRHVWAAAAVAGYLASSLWSTYAFAAQWTHEDARAFVRNATEQLANQDGFVLFDQEVPFTLLGPVAHPNNMASQVLSSVAKLGAFGDATPRLKVFGEHGEIVDGDVWWQRSIGQGPAPGCGYLVSAPADGPGEVVEIPLGGPLIEQAWTAQVNYLSGLQGELEVRLEEGAAVTAPVVEGLGTVYARVHGSGGTIELRALTPGLNVCVGSGPVGLISPAAPR